jgi:multiple sugar transport system ATP-binding protein
LGWWAGPMPEVELKKVVKRWDSVTAVKALDLVVRDRELLVLLGPSGCGKTTTMRMVAGLESVTEGEILVDGVRVNDRPARDRDIAMVFQNYGLYPHMTVAENIGYPLLLRGVPVPERQAQVRATAAKVHLESLLDRRPRALSGGQRQRVALARAIVRTPALFLMDEPLSNLDALLRVSMRAELKRLHHELQTTTIYVTHDQIEAMTLATRVAVMKQGELMQLASPEAIYSDPETLFVASFIGSPPMNQLRGTLKGRTLATPGGILSDMPIQGDGAVVMGFRAEHSRLAPAGEGDLQGTVFSVEFTGAGLWVTLDIGGSLVITAGDPARRPSFDMAMGLWIDRAAAFLFDATTERRLR